MKHILILFLSLLIVSCSSVDNSQRHQYDLKAGKNAILEHGNCLEVIGENFEICLKSINDSRCPSGAVCVWEGDAAVEFSLKSDSENIAFTLHTNNRYQRDTVLNNLEIKLVDVIPFPEFNKPVDQKDYSVELMISYP